MVNLSFEELKKHQIRIRRLPENKEIFDLLNPFTSNLTATEHKKLYIQVSEASDVILSKINDGTEDIDYKLNVDLSRFKY